MWFEFRATSSSVACIFSQQLGEPWDGAVCGTLMFMAPEVHSGHMSGSSIKSTMHASMYKPNAKLWGNEIQLESIRHDKTRKKIDENCVERTEWSELIRHDLLSFSVGWSSARWSDLGLQHPTWLQWTCGQQAAQMLRFFSWLLRRGPCEGYAFAQCGLRMSQDGSHFVQSHFFHFFSVC